MFPVIDNKGRLAKERAELRMSISAKKYSLVTGIKTKVYIIEVVGSRKIPCNSIPLLPAGVYYLKEVEVMVAVS